MNKTAIEWTEWTWNPASGCTKVSQGCKHCYAERLWPRLSAPGQPYQGRRFTDVAFHHERLAEPLKWRKPRKVFVNSMSDLMHPDLTMEQISAVIEVIRQADRHIFQVLTKRPERLASFTWPSNAWLGVSVEDQAAADSRIPLLQQTSASVRFLSCEPLLEPVTLALDGIDWVIVGGETGQRARIMDADWARDIHRQCSAAGVAFFMKQMTHKVEIPADLLVREYPTERLAKAGMSHV